MLLKEGKRIMIFKYYLGNVWADYTLYKCILNVSNMSVRPHGALACFF